MRIYRGIFWQRLAMRRGRLFIPIIFAVILPLIILGTVGWLFLHLYLVSNVGRARSYAEMKEQAELAMKEAGGADVLDKEAKSFVSIFRAAPNLNWADIENCDGKYRAIIKLFNLLSPYGHSPWFVADQKGLPAHVVIRFGSHFHYEYLWIFDPADMPLGQVERAEQLSRTVYLGKTNE